jgi:hypothetical protein
MKIALEEFEVALDLCNNTAPGEDGIRFVAACREKKILAPHF